ncbi:universal stress protein [Nocardia rhizosphaerae]|uniref:Universal stress protein n=1 Tax=Nocardia rhizosphaerae TaxID=1691571 RepID=A0ABV8LC24_9NOCA
MIAARTRPVVVGVDGSEYALNAVRWAARAAVLRHAPLQVVHAMSAGWDLGRAGVLALHDHRLHVAGAEAVAEAAEMAAATVAPAPLAVKTELVSPSPVAALRRRARHAQLVVVGTRGLDAFERTVLGSVSSALARQLSGPLAVVPHPCRSDTERLPVLVGLDGSPDGDRALATAIEEAAVRGVGLLVLHAWVEPAKGLDPARMSEHGHRLLARSLIGYGDKYPDVPITRIAVEGDPARLLLQEAAGAQLIVLGRHRRGHRHHGFGSVSRAILHTTEVPLLLAGHR